MGKKFRKVEKNVNATCRVKFYIIFTLFLMFTINETYGSRGIEHKDIVEDTSGIQYLTSSVNEKVEESSIYNLGIERVNEYYCKSLHLQDLLVILNDYTHETNSIPEFDDSINYNNVILKSDDRISSNKTEEILEEKERILIRFIEALGNLKAKTLIISLPAPSRKVRSFENRTLPEEYSISMKTLNIQKIAFKKVSDAISLHILKSYQFEEPVEVIFENDDSYTWDSLMKLPTTDITYKRILISSISDFGSLTKDQKKKLKKILSVLAVRKLSGPISPNMCSELQNILRESISTLERISIYDYEMLDKLLNLSHNSPKHRKLSLATHSNTGIKDFEFNDSKEENTKENKDIKKYDELVKNEYEVIKAESKCINSHYNYVHAAHSFEVDISLGFTELTPFRLKTILQWAAAHISDATKLTISDCALSAESISVFESMRIEVENMPHLQYLSLEPFYRFKSSRTIVLKDINCREKYIMSMSTFGNEKIRVISGLPLNLYVHAELSNMKENQKKSHSIKHPEMKIADVLVICNGCSLKVFKSKANEKEDRSTKEVLSLQEIESMTYNEFLTSRNRENIERNLKVAYDLNRNIILNEENFGEVINYVLEKPIIILNECLHTVCAACLLKTIPICGTIQCKTCNNLRNISRNFQYFVRAGHTYNIPKEHIYSAQPYGSKGEEVQYILYKCAAFQSSKYYYKILPSLTKPNIIIRKEKPSL